jgi:hypothetical protein
MLTSRRDCRKLRYQHGYGIPLFRLEYRVYAAQ